MSGQLSASLLPKNKPKKEGFPLLEFGAPLLALIAFIVVCSLAVPEALKAENPECTKDTAFCPVTPVRAGMSTLTGFSLMGMVCSLRAIFHRLESRSGMRNPAELMRYLLGNCALILGTTGLVGFVMGLNTIRPICSNQDSQQNQCKDPPMGPTLGLYLLLFVSVGLIASGACAVAYIVPPDPHVFSDKKMAHPYPKAAKLLYSPPDLSADDAKQDAPPLSLLLNDSKAPEPLV
ncbi:MAG: hypothetical protein EBX40_06300 [Gammaproteobacteria bacterium]|nr:hypothetical protein [Gammaproteobacteria bacterium]